MRLRQGIEDSPAPGGGSGRPVRRAAGVEVWAYWLLYLVAMPASWLHWMHGDVTMGLLCATVVLFSVRLITRVQAGG
ncbi:hypothetical protein J4H86_01200 [Spiractinospora alimapuensis]|uniref:hypothetical protein n=1 Tax=Spiractinospora alimapuensis TaxID=2820884 RepID=UPI001F160866|nr:hypothetical protein [Spiractinospora alimapuensis]QVQ52505.1 hypothetical protein J4H86_01200 [Spiractinospora alimapuensis]